MSLISFIFRFNSVLKSLFRDLPSPFAQSHNGFRAPLLGLGWMVFLALTPCFGQEEASKFSEEMISANNRGLAFMGAFDFKSAAEVFDQQEQKFPKVMAFRLNRAIALLNRQKEGDEAKALEILTELSKQHQKPHVIYCRALLELRAGKPEIAIQHLRTVRDMAPDDPDTLYFLGTAYLQMSEAEKALELFQLALKKDPYSQSSVYGSMMAFRRLGNMQEARALMQKFTKLKTNPRARLTEFKYTRMGQFAEAIAIGPETPPANQPSGKLFKVPMELAQVETENPRQSNITICDVDGDTIPEVFLVLERDGTRRVQSLQYDSEGKLHPKSGLPFDALDSVHSILWGDVDDNGRTDAYVLRDGPNVLLLQSEKGIWSDQTETSQTGNGNLNSVDGAMFDADHDGDLDLFVVNADGSNALLNNNRNGTFRTLTLSDSQKESRRVIVEDIDSDGDVDILVLNARPPHDIFINDLLWEYKKEAAWAPLSELDMTQLAVSDLDVDGSMEFIYLTSRGTLHLWSRNQSRTSPLVESTDPLQSFSLADMDGDLKPELLTWTDSKFMVSQIEQLAFEKPETFDQPGIAGLAAQASATGPELIGLTPNGKLLKWPAGPGRFPFALLNLKGIEDTSNSFRSNASGIGTKIIGRVGSHWSHLSTYKNQSQAGQSLQPIMMGAAGAEKLDFVRLEWPDGVLQTEPNLTVKQRHDIIETQRQLSSCPVIFAWDGQGFRFVSDFLGVGGMGYNTGKGSYAPPRPWENFMFPANLLKPRDNQLQILLTEPMEEAAYMDQLKLVAYDLPPGWSMTVDERMGILGPEVTGKPIYYRERYPLARATNQRGQDVSQALMEQDLVPADPGPVHRHFIGMLQEAHRLELQFDRELSGHQLYLVADGWVEYPYSQTGFAAWQAGAEYRAPSVFAKHSDQPWKLILEQFGYPAGMPRQMSVPLPNSVNGATQLRLESNQEIYWDRLFVVEAETCEDVRIQTCTLREATCRIFGFPKRIDHPFRLPDYNWNERTPLWDSKVQEGFYTELGDVRELLEKSDGALAIFGPGEGIALGFDLPITPLPEGWTRTYVLETNGWCKDMDRYTHQGDTLAPIPGTELREKGSDALHKRYQTRFQGGSR